MKKKYFDECLYTKASHLEYAFISEGFPVSLPFFLILKEGTRNRIYKIFPSMKRKENFSSSVVQQNSKNVQITEKNEVLWGWLV